MDVHTKKQRSYNMSQVKSENTKPETVMFSKLESLGIKFERHYPIVGKPDIAFPGKKIVVFIDGEFWHGKDFDKWKNNLTPFWLKKICENIKRDDRTMRKLRSEGWHIIHFWNKKIIRQPDKALNRLLRFIESKQLLS